jgi:hypothetical protein
MGTLIDTDGSAVLRELHLWHGEDDQTVLSVSTPFGDGQTSLRLSGPAAVFLRRTTTRVGGTRMDEVTVTAQFRNPVGGTPPDPHTPRHLLRSPVPAP